MGGIHAWEIGLNSLCESTAPASGVSALFRTGTAVRGRAMKCFKGPLVRFVSECEQALDGSFSRCVFSARNDASMLVFHKVFFGKTP